MRISEVSSPVRPVVGRLPFSPQPLFPMIRSHHLDRPSSCRRSRRSPAGRLLLLILPLLIAFAFSPVDLQAQRKGRSTPAKVAKPAKKKGEPKVVKATESKRSKKGTAKATASTSRAKMSPAKVAESKRGAPKPKRESVVETRPEPQVLSLTSETGAAPVAATERRSTPKIYAPLAGTSFPDSTVIEELADGVSRHRIRTPDGQIVNVLVLDIGRGARLGSYKALDRQDGLETALDIKHRAASILEDTVLAATNASFWSAGAISPIGPTVTSGEVMEVERYKSWSSLLIFDDGTAAIDRISIRGRAIWNGRASGIDDVNRRGKSNGLIVYSDLYGDSLPRGSRKSDSAVIAEALANRVDTTNDHTEAAIDTATVVRLWREEKVKEDREHPMMKIVCEFPKSRRRRAPPPTPVVGEPMALIVTAIDTGVVQIPEHGFVLSPGDQSSLFAGVRPGDTIRLHYVITPDHRKPVRHVLTGTPRLVRHGKAEPEHEIEGSKARRFVRSELARTAVGISRGGDTLFLVTVDSPCRSEGRRGMTLEQLAVLMQNLGAYDAMNFDGGGSTSMAVNGEMISRQGEGPSRRRVSNAFLVMKKSAGKKPRRVTSVDGLGNDEVTTNR